MEEISSPYRRVDIKGRGETAADTTYSDREKKRFLEAMAFTPRSVTWVESTSSRSVEKHLGLHFQYMARYMAPNLWPFSKPKYFAVQAESSYVYACVCILGDIGRRGAG